MSLWSRYYSAAINSENYLRYIYPVYDGGFVACGHILPFAPDTGTQDVWLLRVDSIGCEIANCTISVEELKINHTKIFPNPVLSQIKIELEEVRNYEVEIFDMMGNRILKTKFYGSSTVISLHDYPEGIYLINVLEQHKKKFIQEKF